MSPSRFSRWGVVFVVPNRPPTWPPPACSRASPGPPGTQTPRGLTDAETQSRRVADWSKQGGVGAAEWTRVEREAVGFIAEWTGCWAGMGMGLGIGEASLSASPSSLNQLWLRIVVLYSPLGLSSLPGTLRLDDNYTDHPLYIRHRVPAIHHPPADPVAKLGLAPPSGSRHHSCRHHASTLPRFTRQLGSPAKRESSPSHSPAGRIRAQYTRDLEETESNNFSTPVRAPAPLCLLSVIEPDSDSLRDCAIGTSTSTSTSICIGCENLHGPPASLSASRSVAYYCEPRALRSRIARHDSRYNGADLRALTSVPYHLEEVFTHPPSHHNIHSFGEAALAARSQEDGFVLELQRGRVRAEEAEPDD
ncbi:uncharacterized protein BP5553_06335 [Venustampulla echinocandica]|uniref:Uncharacterized protein n=1 Tax=Venustampulla echinocandica TaxID=2656787 RepID=A0A370TJM9_9HELO|nr:uncharacterized protein BP5553_06335 [Venustampulla echinocandica]RDL35723.1 hypothetical protein BP5553_06335 [Venustampulla echinocandica]